MVRYCMLTALFFLGIAAASLSGCQSGPRHTGEEACAHCEGYGSITCPVCDGWGCTGTEWSLGDDLKSRTTFKGAGACDGTGKIVCKKCGGSGLAKKKSRRASSSRREPGSGKFCASCGKNNDFSAKYCAKCGGKMR